MPRSVVAVLLALLLAPALSGCNQSGRPAPVPVVGPDQAALNRQMGQVVGGAYVVAPGDTLAVVSERTNTPIRTLIDLNGLVPPYVIAPGQRLALQQRSQYVVRSGDTVSGLARKLGITQSALIQLNNLKAPYALRIGQRLNLPSQVEAASDPAPAASPSGSVSQSALPPISAAALPPATAGTAAAPGPAQVSSAAGQPQPGAKPLATPEPAPAATTAGAATTAATMPASIPSSASTTAASTTAAVPASAAPVQPAPAAAPTPSQPAPSQPVPSQPTATQTAATPAAAPPAAEAPEAPTSKAAVNGGKGRFGWPVQGKVIGKFGGGKDGLKNDGINIAAPIGAPVNAAADGVVAYAGNQLRGFGNMILIRHADGYVTAYAHNQSLLVEKGAKVKRGQTIARVGSTGSVDSPQLHFEIRKGTEPLDPLTLLGT